MASLNTNAAAITALRTLQNTNNQLDKTQDRISTGYKIGQAKDNAAYWAISTTLKSDNKSLATVKDALGLGSSTVDVAYQGLNKAKDVLDEIKSKLTASTQDGVDRDTIQNEIKQLQDQLKSIATSSVFSGENWLSVDTSVLGFNPEKQVVASFSRDGSGAVNIGTIKVETANIALFDASTAAGSGGILDGAVNLKGRDGRDLTIGGTDVTTGNNQTAGLGATPATGNAGSDATAVNAASLGGAGAKATVSTGALTLSQYQPGDRVTIRFNVNGTTTTITTAALVPAGASLAVSDIAAAIDTAMTGLADVSESPSGVLKFDAPANGTATKFDLEQFTLRGADGKVKAATNTPAAAAASYETGHFSAVTLDADDHLYFQIKTDDATAPTNVTIDRALIDKTLTAAGHVSGRIASASEFQQVLAAALGAAGVKNVNVAVTHTDQITFTTDSVGAASKLFISNVAASQGGDTITVDTINISNAFFAGKTSDEIKSILSAYIEVVNSAIDKVKNGASALGSVAARIDLQKSFVDTLMDTIDKGVGNLIDADMSEESTRLQALQVKQQLGVQALSIANQSSQNILSLFQSNR